MGKKKKDAGSNELLIASQDDWDNLKTVSGLVVVDVYTKWAGPCIVMKPIIYKLKNGVSKMKIYYVYRKGIQGYIQF